MSTAAGYETFIRDLAHLRIGKKALLTLRTLEPGRGKYLATNAVVRVANDSKGPDWAPLVVRSAVGHRYPETYFVQVVETLPSLIPGKPYEDAYELLRKTWADRLDA